MSFLAVGFLAAALGHWPANEPGPFIVGCTELEEARKVVSMEPGQEISGCYMVQGPSGKITAAPALLLRRIDGPISFLGGYVCMWEALTPAPMFVLVPHPKGKLRGA